MRKLLTALTVMAAVTLPLSAFATTQVEVTTNVGNFTIQLDEQKAPISSKNFLRYVEDGSYEGTIFHRVIPGFMAQGGGFDEDLTRRPSYDAIKNEATNGLKNDRATVAMARTQDPHSATRQFYINYQNNSFLNANGNQAGYAVFGKVVKGFSVIEKMATIPTTTIRSMGMKDVPQQPIVIKTIKTINN
ncbi:peptidylprolyl isomerase [Photobacterium sanguinicancri]|uniref:Peptidyl-prolyl cis-trans isomerase n=1 Tax=Photobacterium sanguinicancri TaxID=875932 RepID=A0AAW7YA90_9GAMM|nr:peptidylprolyl isomerase [Photobacterium sanguinicancri]MDO6544910.1 peptidylprolyl isomerase [Photobacterium sanguinicancri]OZS42799.1 peptidyl-prolyl cis-trans isomerase [Photobacterium sanguinicancri]